jgi:hypothetical protein
MIRHSNRRYFFAVLRFYQCRNTNGELQRKLRVIVQMHEGVSISPFYSRKFCSKQLALFSQTADEFYPKLP